jgi:hypothetical protein
MDWIDHLQWPAMLVTVAASWLVSSRTSSKRSVAFWLFLASNVLWTAWGLYAHAYALIGLQLGLAVINIRGAKRNDDVPDEAG